MERSSPTRRSSPPPIGLAVLVTSVALLHLAFGQAIGQRTALASLAVVAALMVGVLGASPRSPSRLLMGVAAVGVGAAVLLGVSYR